MNSLSDQVYKLLYDKSRLSDGDIGVRVCHEDEWPIDEIVKLIHEESRDALAQDRQFIGETERTFYQLGYNDAKELYSKPLSVVESKNNGKGLPAKRRRKLESPAN